MPTKPITQAERDKWLRRKDTEIQSWQHEWSARSDIYGSTFGRTKTLAINAAIRAERAHGKAK